MTAAGATATVTYTDNATGTFTLPVGPRGATGATGAAGADGSDGRGITMVTAVGATATVTYTDSTTGTFTLPAGPQGSDGKYRFDRNDGRDWRDRANRSSRPWHHFCDCRRHDCNGHLYRRLDRHFLAASWPAGCDRKYWPDRSHWPNRPGGRGWIWCYRWRRDGGNLRLGQQQRSISPCPRPDPTSRLPELEISQEFRRPVIAV